MPTYDIDGSRPTRGLERISINTSYVNLGGHAVPVEGVQGFVRAGVLRNAYGRRRVFVQQEPDLQGLFETRRLKS